MSHSAQVISSNQNPLFVELTSPKSTLIIAKLKNVLDENTIIVQRDSKSLNYGIICILPEIRRKYVLQIFAKKDGDENENSYACVAEYWVETLSSEIELEAALQRLPKYLLEFNYGLKCLSHSAQVICSESEVIDLQFLTNQKSVCILGKLKEKLESIFIENTVLTQAIFVNETNKKFTVKISMPKKNTFYDFVLFAKENNDIKTYTSVTTFRLIRNGGMLENTTRFLKILENKFDSFIYSPLEYNLLQNHAYEFKCYVKHALNVALVDSSGKWHYLERKNNENEFMWSLQTSFETIGDLNLFAKITEGTNFDGLCSYQITC